MRGSGISGTGNGYASKRRQRADRQQAHEQQQTLRQVYFSNKLLLTYEQHHGGSAQRVRPEVTRVAREVGTEGKLGGQAQVPGVAGTWKDLTDNVNFMASNLTGQVRNIVAQDHGRREG